MKLKTPVRYGIIDSLVGEADFLCLNGPKVSVEELTVFPTNRRNGAFLLEVDMPRPAKGGNMFVKPLRGRILVEVLSDNEVSAGGIILAKTMKEIAHCGRVVAVGDPIVRNGKEVSAVANVGEKIHWKKYKGKPIDYNGKTHLFLINSEIVGVEK